MPKESANAEKDRAQHEGSIKETFISLIISFVMALVFRSYVVEAFVIPTGSMAPTLRGAHMQFRGVQTGYSWAVNPWYPGGNDPPYPIQGQSVAGHQLAYGPPSVTDPMTTSLISTSRGQFTSAGSTGFRTRPEIKRVRAGDRILVQKYLYEIFPPQRWDVVVFKNPELSTQNFIKRLVGLPGEQIWIVDGDVFVRHADDEPWQIARKPRRVQRRLWQTVYSSEYAPRRPEVDGRVRFTAPWAGEGWAAHARRVYHTDSARRTTLSWKTGSWPIWDWVPYNEFPDKLSGLTENQRFPVGDLRVRAGVEPERAGLRASATIRTRGHEFRAVFEPGRAALEMRRYAPGAAAGMVWEELAEAEWKGFEPGSVTNVEFWHFDQSVALILNGRRVAEAEYDWTADQRLEFATGRTVADFDRGSRGDPLLHQAQAYNAVWPSIEWSFEGSPVSLHRVGLDRDLYYEPAHIRGSGIARATHPSVPARLGPDHFFVLGDNSPSSKDGRLWSEVDPAVAQQIDSTVGVVHRKLLLGKAFFVYFPAPHLLGGRIPIPDFGHMRFIR